MNWKYFYSSVKGTSHIASNTPKQDNCGICVFKDYLIATIADGAGSAKYSDLSSKLFVSCLSEKLNNGLQTIILKV